MPGSGSILTSGPSLPGEFAHASFQRGHAGFKVGRLSHAGSGQRWPPPGVAEEVATPPAAPAAHSPDKATGTSHKPDPRTAQGG